MPGSVGALNRNTWTRDLRIGPIILLAWMGWVVLQVLEGDTLVSLPEVSVQITQSVIPIGAVLFIIAELLSIPEYWTEVKAGISTEHPPMMHEPSTEK